MRSTVNIKSVSIVLYASLCSRTLRSLRSLRFNHSHATGIDMTHNTNIAIEIRTTTKYLQAARQKTKHLLTNLIFSFLTRYSRNKAGAFGLHVNF
jgi:hypothetical protein